MKQPTLKPEKITVFVKMSHYQPTKEALDAPINIPTSPETLARMLKRWDLHNEMTMKRNSNI